MAYLRFHKSKALLPGVRLNLSKSGASLSVGPKGAKVNIGPHGIRTTASLPGTGLSLIEQTSWNPKTRGKVGSHRRRRTTADVVDAAMDRMTKDQQRALMEEIVAKSSPAEVKRQRDEFEAYIAEHAAEIGDGDTADFAEARQIYADAIATKRAEGRRQAADALVLAAIAALAMWYGIVAGSGWLIAGSLVLLLVVGCTQAGQRLMAWLSNLLLGLAALGFAGLAIAVIVFVILALTGGLSP